MPIESKDIPLDRFILNFGPSHPATHGTLRVVLELDGEVITKATTEIGYLHSGFEKLGEHLDYNQYITITDRMNYLSPLNNNIGFALAVEKLLNISVPKRAQYIRVLMAELSRIADHILQIGMLAVDLGAFTVFLYGFQVREMLYDIFEKTCGSRLTTSYTRIGGLMRDLNDEIIQDIRTVLKKTPPILKDIEGLLNRNRIFQNRTKAVGAISRDDAIAYGLSGPVARASGVDRDLRVADPYSSYDEFEFDVPIALNGDVFDRYLVRVEEIYQSMRICHQAIENLPEGPVNVDSETGYVLPPKDDVYNSIEGLIYHFEISMKNRGFIPVKGEVYSATESPNGELGWYIISDGGREPYRVRVRPPSLINYSIFEKLMEGAMISDIVAVMGSLNVIAGELDR